MLDFSTLSQEEMEQLLRMLFGSAADPMGPFSNEDVLPPPVAGEYALGIKVLTGFHDVYGPDPFSAQYRDAPLTPGAGSPWHQAAGRFRQLAREFGGLVSRGDPNYPGDSVIAAADEVYGRLGMGSIRLFYGRSVTLNRYAVMAYFPKTQVKQDILYVSAASARAMKFPTPLRPWRVEGYDGDPNTALDDPGLQALDPANFDTTHANFVLKLKRDGLPVPVASPLIEEK